MSGEKLFVQLAVATTHFLVINDRGRMVKKSERVIRLSRHPSEKTFRRLMELRGHTDIKVYPLPEPMNNMDAVWWMVLNNLEHLPVPILETMAAALQARFEEPA